MPHVQPTFIVGVSFMSPLISVIVPVYNLEQYIQRTLDSLFAQTHRELQVIAVDDGSTDGSQRILREYAAKEPRLLVIHQENAGVSAARNTGLDAATGDYIGFCDGDDLVEPVMYERLLGNLQKNDADISHCGMLIEGLDGRKRFFYNTEVLEVHSHDQGLLELLSGKRIEPTLCDKLFKRELFQGVRMDPAIKINEDLLLNVILFHKAIKTVFEDVCLYRYIRRESSASKSAIAEKHVFHPVRVREKISELMKDESAEVQRIARVSYLHSNISTYTMLLAKKAVAFSQFRSQFRQNLGQHKDWLKQLPTSSRIHAWVILYLPFLCKPLFALYYALHKGTQYG